jgi:hypothetical protein
VRQWCVSGTDDRNRASSECCRSGVVGSEVAPIQEWFEGVQDVGPHCRSIRFLIHQPYTIGQITYKVNDQLDLGRGIILEKSHPGLTRQPSLVPPLQNGKDRVEIQRLECTMTVEVDRYMPCQQTLGAMLIDKPDVDFD